MEHATVQTEAMAWLASTFSGAWHPRRLVPGRPATLELGDLPKTPQDQEDQ